MTKNECLAALGLSGDPSDTEIKAAYRKLAQRHHPDKGGDEKTFSKINDAYTRLKKKSYDYYDSPYTNKDKGFHTGFGFGEFNFDDIIDVMRRKAQQSQNVLVFTATLKQIKSGFNINYTKNNETITISIPKGCPTNTIMKDSEGSNIKISLAKEKFSRVSHDSLDVLYTTKLSVLDIVVGCELELTNFDGKVLNITLPAGFTGKYLRVPNVGLEDYNGNKGNLLVSILPCHPDLTKKELEAIRKVIEAIRKRIGSNKKINID